MHIFLLARSEGNGEYSEETHLSAHQTFRSAIKKFEEIVTTQEGQGEDAPNKWVRKYELLPRNEEDVTKLKLTPLSAVEYITGAWGYIRYCIAKIDVEGSEDLSDTEQEMDNGMWKTFLQQHPDENYK